MHKDKKKKSSKNRDRRREKKGLCRFKTESWMVGIQTDKKRHNKKQVCKGEGGKRRRKNSDTLKRYDAAWGQIKSGDTNFSFFFFWRLLSFPKTTQKQVFFFLSIYKEEEERREKKILFTQIIFPALWGSREIHFFTRQFTRFFFVLVSRDGRGTRENKRDCQTLRLSVSRRE